MNTSILDPISFTHNLNKSIWYYSRKQLDEVATKEIFERDRKLASKIFKAAHLEKINLSCFNRCSTNNSEINLTERECLIKCRKSSLDYLYSF